MSPRVRTRFKEGDQEKQYREPRLPQGRATGTSQDLPVCGTGHSLEEGWQKQPLPQPPQHAAGLPY